MDSLLPHAPHPLPAPPGPLLAATLAQGIDLALCAIPVVHSRPHLFGEEKGGSVVPNRGGIHGQGPGEGSRLPGTSQAWRTARRERDRRRGPACTIGAECYILGGGLCVGGCRRGEEGVSPPLLPSLKEGERGGPGLRESLVFHQYPCLGSHSPDFRESPVSQEP